MRRKIFGSAGAYHCSTRPPLVTGRTQMAQFLFPTNEEILSPGFFMSASTCHQLDFRLKKVRHHCSTSRPILASLRDQIQQLKVSLSTRDDAVDSSLPITSPLHENRHRAETSTDFRHPQNAETDIEPVSDNAIPSATAPRLGQGWGADIELDDLL